MDWLKEISMGLRVSCRFSHANSGQLVGLELKLENILLQLRESRLVTQEGVSLEVFLHCTQPSCSSPCYWPLSA